MVRIIVRKKDSQSFSIEKVFDTIMPFLKKEIDLSVDEVPFRAASLKALFVNFKAVHKLKGELFHITGDIHYVALALPGKKTILTIHDCVFLNQASGIKRLVMKKLWLQWPVAHVARVTTISEKSKQEIIKHTNCDPGKILVIPNPVSPQIEANYKEFNNETPVVLFIGTKKNKNLLTAIEGLKGIKCHLDIIGVLDSEQKTALRNAGISFSSSFGLSEEEIINKYSSCDILLFPSTYEGFGLPIIEAQKMGRVVVSSNISPMKDVAGDGAHLVDPYDPVSIHAGILKVIVDKGYRESLVKAGSSNAEKYGAHEIAATYNRLYKSMLKYKYDE